MTRSEREPQRRETKSRVGFGSWEGKKWIDLRLVSRVDPLKQGGDLRKFDFWNGFLGSVRAGALAVCVGLLKMGVLVLCVWQRSTERAPLEVDPSRTTFPRGCSDGPSSRSRVV
jgi:hypothetical protein